MSGDWEYTEETPHPNDPMLSSRSPDPSTEALDKKLERLEMEARAHIDPSRTLMRLTPEARYTATYEQLAYDRVLRRADRMEAERDALAARLRQAEEENVQLEAERVYEHARAEVAERRFSQAEEPARLARLYDGPELRHWLGSQDVIDETPQVHIAQIVRAALAASSAGETPE